MQDEIEFVGAGTLPGEPTDALPGTEKKIRIMTERVTRHEQLFHPKDGLRQESRRPCNPITRSGPWSMEPTGLVALASVSPDHNGTGW